MAHSRIFIAVSCLAYVLVFSYPAHAASKKLSIFHFDVNTGDATLIVSPNGHAVLIDAGDKSRGEDPIVEFLNRSKNRGFIKSLDYTVVTHYDADHIGGMDEVYRKGWYPKKAAYDRGDANMRWFSKQKAEACSNIDADEVENIVPWGTAPEKHCPKNKRAATCEIMQYLFHAEKGGKRKPLAPGDTIKLDHGIKLTTVVANAVDIDDEKVDVYFDGRRKDCAENDFSIGLLLSYGDFRYFIAGDLTGDRRSKVADVEELIKDDVKNVDVYHVNHHGAKTSSSTDFMQVLLPTVAIVSNGEKHGHPIKSVINERILSLDPKPMVFLTNRNTDDRAWQGSAENIADANLDGVDGVIEIAVWKKTYRVYRWRNGKRLAQSSRFNIKRR